MRKEEWRWCDVGGDRFQCVM